MESFWNVRILAASLSSSSIMSAFTIMRASAPALTMRASAVNMKLEWNPNSVEAFPGAVSQYMEERPPHLDGSMTGDIGFDPMCMAAYAWPVFQEKGMSLFGEAKPGLILSLPDLSAARRVEMFSELSTEEQKAAVQWMREAELKHGRLAMLAAVGWPLSELVNWGFLHQWGDLNGRAPSLFNGGLLENYGLFWLAFLGAASYAELTSIGEGLGANGDYKLDPLGLATGKDLEDMRLKELKNGRVAMMAITGFAVQEFVYGSPVVEQTGMFFGRF